MERIDIKKADVFISWTGKDAALKDSIADYLSENNLTVLESKGECTGRYLQWSIEAAKSATVFLLILTENTCKSKNVPLEILSALEMEDAENRIIVVCSSQSIFRDLPFENFDPDELHKRKISVIEMDERGLTDGTLADIKHKAELLIINQTEKIYRANTKPAYIKLIMLYKTLQRSGDREESFENLYIPRTVTEYGEGGSLINYDSPDAFIKSDGVFFMCGPAGSGKTQYINQIRSFSDEGTVIVSLSCSKVAGSERTLFGDMYQEVYRILGNRTFYSEANFERLLSERRLFLILDGVDEIATEEGVRAFLRKVEDYYIPNIQKTTVFFTGRDIKGADLIAMNGRRTRKLYLDALTDEKVKTLCDNLFLIFGANEQGREFYVSIRDLTNEIRTNPLLLSQLAIIYRDSGKIPETVVGIFDAISEITFRMDAGKTMSEIPQTYREMVRNIGTLLKEFSKERYRLLSAGKPVTPVKIFSKILAGYADKTARAEFLVEYLQSRAILTDGEFYHKLFLEYFTAVCYYENCFDDYDELVNTEALKELFSHYSDNYWKQVIQMFLIKADSCIDGAETENLYSGILTVGEIADYTLLFDTCRDLIKHEEEAQVTLVSDVLFKSAEKTYPPYGPLFWYVPEYKLYEATLLAAEKLTGNAKALALARDVCYIYGQKNIYSDVTKRVDGARLFEAAKNGLKGVRKALCEIFYLGDTKCEEGKDIYPRCFNVPETLSFRDYSCGVGGRMPTPFEDELGLYEHTSYNEMNGECYGLISCPYDDGFENYLRPKNTAKVTGLCFSPANREVFADELKFYSNSVNILYYPENMTKKVGYFFRIPFWFGALADCVITENGIYYLFGDVVCPWEYSGNTINNSTFGFCKSIVKLRISMGVMEIGEFAFNDCINLTAISIPDNVTKIGKGAFLRCISLTEVKIPENLTEIEYWTFAGCRSLTEIKIPESVTKIGNNAFADCSSLMGIKIPENVTEIGLRAFTNCLSLNEMQIPEGVKEIGDNAFEGCEGLKSIILPQRFQGQESRLCLSENTVIKWLYKEKQIPIIPKGATEIEEGAFEECFNLKEMPIPDSVKVIGAKAFKCCINLEKVHVPNGVIEIDRSAFEGCSGLQEINIPYSVTEIKRSVFKGCRRLKEITIPKNVTKIENYTFLGCSSLMEIEIPENVTEIGSRAFKGCSNLRKITIPERVTNIFDGAFRDCSSLAEIEIPESITSIGVGVFFGCSSLTEMEIPENVTGIGGAAFSGCSSLREVRIPQNVTWIGFRAFEGCSSLTEITIPEKITRIFESTFLGCNSLTKIKISENLTEIYFEAFKGCSSLTEITIPENVTFIDDGAFQGCSGLREIDIPKGVYRIGDDAFAGCTGLEKVTISSNFRNDIKRIFGDIDLNIIEFI